MNTICTWIMYHWGPNKIEFSDNHSSQYPFSVTIKGYWIARFSIYYYTCEAGRSKDYNITDINYVVSIICCNHSVTQIFFLKIVANLYRTLCGIDRFSAAFHNNTPREWVINETWIKGQESMQNGSIDTVDQSLLPCYFELAVMNYM